ncbi:MAG: helix-turn-helix domain-containing protein [Chthoniobacterales bacterium]
MANLDDPAQVRNLFTQIHHLASSHSLYYLEELSALALQLYIIYKRAFARQNSTSKISHTIVQRAQILMHANVDATFHVGAFAASENVSEAYFRRCFRTQIGLSPQQYLMSLRQREAENRLEFSNAQVTQIADDLGFSSPYHFSAWFKSRLSCSPSLWRTKRRQS